MGRVITKAAKKTSTKAAKTKVAAKAKKVARTTPTAKASTHKVAAKKVAAATKATPKASTSKVAAKAKTTARASATKATAKASTKTTAKASSAATPTLAPPASPFAGKTVVLTGTFATMKRSAAESLLTAVGARMSGSISAKTDLLIHGADAGSKLSKAQGLGVKTMTEPEMVALLQNTGAGASQLAGAAEKIAAQQGAEASKLGVARPIVDAVNTKQIAKYGRTIAQLLRLWIRVFAQRPDIRVVDNKIGQPTSTATIAALATRLPPDVLALAAESGPLHFCWMFADKDDETDGSYEGNNGGRINLVGFKHFRWYDRPPEWDFVSYKAQAMFDELQAEGSTMLSHDPGQSETEASLIFDDANDCERHFMGSVEMYLTGGARRAFVWYWPKSDYWEAKDLVARLVKGSIARSSPEATIHAGLVARGLGADEAHAIYRWLGRDATLLLPK